MRRRRTANLLQLAGITCVVLPIAFIFLIPQLSKVLPLGPQLPTWLAMTIAVVIVLLVAGGGILVRASESIATRYHGPSELKPKVRQKSRFGLTRHDELRSAQAPAASLVGAQKAGRSLGPLRSRADSHLQQTSWILAAYIPLSLFASGTFAYIAWKQFFEGRGSLLTASFFSALCLLSASMVLVVRKLQERRMSLSSSPQELIYFTEDELCIDPFLVFFKDERDFDKPKEVVRFNWGAIREFEVHATEAGKGYYRIVTSSPASQLFVQRDVRLMTDDEKTFLSNLQKNLKCKIKAYDGSFG